jgi:hypothetical protein
MPVQISSDHRGVDGGQWAGVGTARAGKTTIRVRPSSLASACFELLAQRIDRLLRHVDAGDEGLPAAERRRGRAGAGADAAGSAEVGIDDGKPETRPARVRRHRDRGVGAVGQAAVAAGAVGRVDDRCRLWSGVRQQRQGEEQGGDPEQQRPDDRRRAEVGQRMNEQDEPVEIECAGNGRQVRPAGC